MIDEERDEVTEEETEEPEEDDGILLKFKDEDARQEWLDKQFDGRYKRKQKEMREQERAELEKEFARKEAKEKGEYRELYETAESKIGEQAAIIEGLESKVGDFEAKDERIRTLEAQIEAFIKPDLERVPEHYRELVGAMSIDQQASWLTRNREQLAGPSAPIGSPPSPPVPPRDNGRDRREYDKEASEAQSARVTARL